MPAEKFYPSTAIEGEPSDRFEIGWSRDYDGVYLTMVLHNDSAEPPHASGIPLDRSGINRMIRTLRRARDATFGADE